MERMQTTRSSSSSLMLRECAAWGKEWQIAEGGPSLALDSTDDPATTSLNCPSFPVFGVPACLQVCLLRRRRQLAGVRRPLHAFLSHW